MSIDKKTKVAEAVIYKTGRKFVDGKWVPHDQSDRDRYAKHLAQSMQPPKEP